ncbi:MAG: ATP-dependent DNA ligase [Bacteroidota bacterium]
MKEFAQLFRQLDQTTKINLKVESLAAYFEQVSDRDKLWTIAILSHRRPSRTVKTSLLRQWAAELSQIPLWLFEESYHIVGDLAETIASILPPADRENEYSLTYWIDYIKGLKNLPEEEQREYLLDAWGMMDHAERFVFNKLITGGFRMGVSQKLMVRALSKYTKVDENKLTHRLMGHWDPGEDDFQELIFSENPADDLSKPYPFYLAYALEGEPEALGAIEEWQAERKWDGIRGQLIVRGGELFVWSRGEELVTDKFPEYQALLGALPDGTVIDGEILPYKDGKILSFNLLQTRIGRKNLSKKILSTAPVAVMAYDLLEFGGEDLRERPLSERRQLLEQLMASEDLPSVFMLSDCLQVKNWDELRQARAESRNFQSEGLMLKRKNSPYRVGRKKGDWWKWKVDPLTIDAVMIYAQRGHGRRANLYTDYTFAVWEGEQLVPFAKAYSGLTDAEIRRVDAFVKRNTKERFGPVRSVKPELVFELAFEGINKSSRHKSGVALRFPRILRWREDKPTEEANTLDDLKALLKLYGNDQND